MTFIFVVTLTTTQSLLFLALCAWLVWSGRPEWVLGIYLSMATWTRSVMIFGVVHTWVLLATLLCAATVFWVRHGLRFRLPGRDRWIIAWLAVWTAWMLLLIALFQPADTMPILRGWLLYTLIPVCFVPLFGYELRGIRGLAVSFLATSVVSGWVALAVLDIPLEYLLYDPTLQSFGVLRLNIENYHFIGAGFGIALILAAGLLVASRSRFSQLLILLASGWCAYFLVLTGSKQSIFFGAAVVVLLTVWVSIRRGLGNWQMLLATSLLVGVGLWLYQLAPSLVLRSQDTTLSAVLDASIAERLTLWGEGFDIFLESPLWGSGFTQAGVAHNLVISTLADQGLVGFGFLVGALVFLVRQGWRVVRDPIGDERTIWRMVLVCLALFGLLHVQVSGAAYSSWEVFWGGALLWILRSAPTAAARRVKVVARTALPTAQAESRIAL
jgi:O-antigen ligase